MSDGGAIIYQLLTAVCWALRALRDLRNLPVNDLEALRVIDVLLLDRDLGGQDVAGVPARNQAGVVRQDDRIGVSGRPPGLPAVERALVVDRQDGDALCGSQGGRKGGDGQGGDIVPVPVADRQPHHVFAGDVGNEAGGDGLRGLDNGGAAVCALISLPAIVAQPFNDDRAEIYVRQFVGAAKSIVVGREHGFELFVTLVDFET